MKNWNTMSKFYVIVEYKNGTINDYFVYEDVWYDYLHKALENDNTVTHYTVDVIKQKGRCDMNRFRREELSGAIKLLEQAYSIIENCRDDEQDAYDNLPDGIQDSERGETMYYYISEMEECMDAIDNITDCIYNDIIS